MDDKDVTYSFKRTEIVNILRTILTFLDKMKLTQSFDVLVKECADMGYPDVMDEGRRNALSGLIPVIETSPQTSCSLSSVDINGLLKKENRGQNTENCEGTSHDKAEGTEDANETNEQSNKKDETQGTDSDLFHDEVQDSKLVCSSTVIYKNLTMAESDAFGSDSENVGHETTQYYETLEKRYSNLKHDHKKLAGVAAELTDVLETNLLDQSHKLNEALDKCKVIYPRLFKEGEKREIAINTVSESCTKATSEANLLDIIGYEDVGIGTYSDENEASEDDLSSKNVEKSDIKEIEELHNNVRAKMIDDVALETKHRRQYTTKSDSSSAVQRRKEKQLVSKISSKSCSDIHSAAQYVKFKAFDTSVKYEKSCVVEKKSAIVFKEVTNKGDTVKDAEKVFNFCVPKACNSSEFIGDGALDNCESKEVTMENYFELNFSPLKKDLLDKHNIGRKLLILQALRWRVTKSTPDIRQTVIHSYIKNDILVLLNPFSNVQLGDFLESFYCPVYDPAPHPLQEGIARLVNTFASLNVGRDYLTHDDHLLVKLLLPLILGTHPSKVILGNVTRDMLFATLQKLSLRNRQRHHMISAGLVEFVITFLSMNHKSASNYCLEYCTALLMNLCLHSEARERCRSRAEEVITILINLLEKEKSYCIPYINGTMYSLLGDTFINSEARRQGLGELIMHYIECTHGEIQRQLKFVYKVHFESKNGSCKNVCPHTPSETEEEFDLLEVELDQNDIVKGDVQGELMLLKYKLDSTNNAQPGMTDPDLNCLCRPAQPLPRLPLNKVPAESVKNNGCQEYGKMRQQESESNSSKKETEETISREDKSSAVQNSKPKLLDKMKRPAKLGRKRIFQKNIKNAICVPPSFTRSFGITKKETEKSQAPLPRQIPYNLFNNVGVCYRDSSNMTSNCTGFHPKTLFCPGRCCACQNFNYCGCENFNKYMCGCYDSMKAYIDNTNNYGEVVCDQFQNGSEFVIDSECELGLRLKREESKLFGENACFTNKMCKDVFSGDTGVRCMLRK